MSHAAGIASVAAACGFALLLSVRLVNSTDLGYHLAYGEEFFATGKTVDTCPFIYTLSEGPPLVDRSQIGPGCWYDRGGTYRFANANWLSQLLITLLYRLGGIAAMSLVVTACVGLLLALCLLMMRRLEVPWTAAAAGVLVMALAAQGRFAPRPEILGYALLVAQLYLLLAPLLGQRVISIRAVVGLVVLQVLLVNVHSYFLLSLAMTFSMLVDQLLRLAWWQARRMPDPTARQLVGGNARRLGIAFGGQLAACLVNPWTWRLALLPLQTLVFLKEHDVTATKFPGVRHPWSAIAEFTNTPGAISSAPWYSMSFAIPALLALAGAGILASLAYRRWGGAMILAGMAAVALSMLRNAAPASFLIVPTALWALHPVASGVAARSAPAKVRAVSLIASAAIILLSTWWGVGVVTGGFYVRDGSPERFGIGFARLHFPLDAARWLNENKPVGRMWTDFNLSSNLHYFTRPHRDVPVLTNTWALPPDALRMVLDYIAGRDFEDMRLRYGIEIVAVENGITAEPLVRTLSHDPNWGIAYLSPYHLIFLRREGPNAELVKRCGITPETLDVQAYKKEIAALDPVPEQTFFLAGVSFYRMKWDTPAIVLLEETIPARRPNHLELNTLGVCYGRRAVRRLQAGDSGWMEDIGKARECFEKALRLKPDYAKALQNLSLVRRQVESFQQGVLLVPEE